MLPAHKATVTARTERSSQHKGSHGLGLTLGGVGPIISSYRQIWSCPQTPVHSLVLTHLAISSTV